MLRLWHATRNSWNGLIAASRSEHAFRKELAVFGLAVPLAYFIALDIWRWVVLLAVLLLILIVELLNTAVEKLSDHVTPQTHPAIGRIKDMASAAVGLSLLLAALVWLVALAERLAML